MSVQGDVPNTPADFPSRPRVGISRCLLGDPVRYDGRHKYNQVIAEALGSHFQWVPVCPEVECGLGVPRETLHLLGRPTAPKLVSSDSNRDMTNQMVSFADVRVRDLLQTGIHGFVLKARSPSCGLADVEIRDHNAPNKKGRGLFALALTTHCPALPVEDEAGLQDRGVRDRFIKRVVEYQKRSVS